jgi:hypothetical protein
MKTEAQEIQHNLLLSNIQVFILPEIERAKTIHNQLSILQNSLMVQQSELTPEYVRLTKKVAEADKLATELIVKILDIEDEVITQQNFKPSFS